ncbi:MerR family transcriptional regulator [Actinoplanes sp. URMC 104]|uniref:MerR family transcriptional regulator n=1 Tax=Actinoplanes sp. URMC 104 TaxID=3423409 RepID=UPI003F1D3394
MRIGELSRRTQIPVRMLRYYEERGLLTPQRTPSGYRSYEETHVEQAALISSLIRSGLPTRLIIPLLRRDHPGPADDGELAGLFAAELERLNSRIECMTLSRDAVRKHLDGLRRGPGAPGPRRRSGGDGRRDR